MKDIHPIILCGGSGSRLWPVSRVQSPKQFHAMNGPGSLSFFQATVQRHRAAGFARPTVVTSVQHSHTVARQLEALQCDARVICEPMTRNTGPAVLAAAIEVASEDPEALLLIAPSDHVIEGDLNRSILEMRTPATAGRIVMFGIPPRYAETGYGYLVDGGSEPGQDGLRRVKRFVEKPPSAEAQRLIDTEHAFWASGLSLMTASTLIKDMRRYDEATYHTVFSAVDQGERSGAMLTLHPPSFRRAADAPTEKLIFEHSDRVCMAVLDVGWDDVGCWTAMHAVNRSDPQGNVLLGDVLAVETENAFVRADKRLVAVVGLSDVIVVDTPDAILVTQRGRCQDVRRIVHALKADERPEAVAPLAKEYHWGQTTRLMRSGRFDMSVIKINPGASIKIDSMPGRQLIAIGGSLQVFDGQQRRDLGMGERLVMPPIGRTSLTNTQNDPVEALLVTVALPMEDEIGLGAVQNA
ncbi:sugar phosphate nucleotidyltransferase [Cognatishimia sp. SS12]|uniref:mannose-1-phosphate guanylyltransferase n=1 Tax=Cognatishimia sp. SS12 TaxID=2979465 RepID=UPI00232DC1EB|nr:sugar phosphate nucleotidyltransferase [Cognatishimia sp. SS12]MDC0738707.1 sugar phosphate nucleotidyltransferase [Cognatishimia sp. SS12]